MAALAPDPAVLGSRELRKQASGCRGRSGKRQKEGLCQRKVCGSSLLCPHFLPTRPDQLEVAPGGIWNPVHMIYKMGFVLNVSDFI